MRAFVEVGAVEVVDAAGDALNAEVACDGASQRLKDAAPGYSGYLSSAVVSFVIVKALGDPMRGWRNEGIRKTMYRDTMNIRR
jgi:hypothetical protein